MKFRIHMHSRPGIWKYYKGYMDVYAPTIHQAVARAKKRLYTAAFPSRPSGTWIVDDVQINRLEFEAEESRSGQRMRPGPTAVPGLLSGAAAQAGTAPERWNSVHRKGEET